jgi:hypothetical protein
MSGVALDVPVSSSRPRSFMRLLLAVLLGYVGALITLVLVALPLLAFDLLPRPVAQPGPFLVEGTWSLDADIVVWVALVLFAAWWIRRMVEDATRGPVSFGVVALAVALTGFAPLLMLRLAALWGLLALVLTTWIIRRYAIGTTLPFQRPAWWVCLLLGVVGVLILGSYRVYHPLTADGASYTDSFTFTPGKPYRELKLRNAGWANMTILRVDGGWAGPTEGWIRPHKLPYTIPSRGRVGIFVAGRACVPRDVNVTFSVLGRISTQRFAVQPDTVAPGFHAGAVPPC